MPLFQSNLREQIRKLPKILQFVKITHYFSKLFTSLLSHGGALARGEHTHSVRRQNRGDDEAGVVDEPVNGVAMDVYLTPGGGEGGGIGNCLGTQTLAGPFWAVSKPMFATTTA